MKESVSQLPEGTDTWIESVTGHRVTSMVRHVARREAWLIVVETESGKEQRYFLRIDRNALKGHPGPWSLARETAIIKSFEATAVPAQKILAWSDERQLALQEMVAGEGELNLVGRDQQHAVMNDFVDALAKLHALDPHKLGIDESVHWPTTPEELALNEVALIEELWRPMAEPETAGALFTAYGKRWLENHVQDDMAYSVLVQGDTGPANFMFEGDKVTAFVDWEWAHIGDPMEDWGNIVVRDFFYPSSGGDFAPYFARYQAASGIPIDIAKVKYYCVQQLLRSVMSLLYTVRTLKWHDEVAMNLGYEVNCQRAMCDAIARAMAVSISGEGMPEHIFDVDKELTKQDDQRILRILVQQMQNQILPAQEDGFVLHKATHATAMIEYLQRLRLYGDALDEFELIEISRLLNSPFDSLANAEKALMSEITAMSSEKEEVKLLEYLYKRAYRLEDLMEPLVRPFANRSLAKVD